MSYHDPSAKERWKLANMVYFRFLHKIKVKRFHLVPRLDDVLAKLSGFNIFPKLDLGSGYHKIRDVTW